MDRDTLAGQRKDSDHAFKKVLAVIPKAQFARIFGHASTVEADVLRGYRALFLLVELREYLVAQHGADNPHVQMIDAVLEEKARPAAAAVTPE